MINKVILLGRLTADPELKKTPAGVSVTSFSIAVQRNFKDANGEYLCDFIDIVAWRKTAEFIAKFFKKGQEIGIVGSIQMRRYEDKNGNKRVAVEIIAEEASFVGSKKDSETSDTKVDLDVTDGFEEVEDEDLPF